MVFPSLSPGGGFTAAGMLLSGCIARSSSWTREKRPPVSGRPLHFVKLLAPRLFRALSSGVLGVAEGFSRRALGLVDLAFDLHLFVVGHFAECVLHRALGLVGRALDVFLVHGSSPMVVGPQNKRFSARKVPFALGALSAAQRVGEANRLVAMAGGAAHGG